MDGMGGSRRTTRALQKAEELAQDAQHKADSIQRRVEELERKNEALTEVLLATWDLVSQKTGLADAELKACIQAVRAQRTEARSHQREASLCPQCSRPLRRGQDTCMYCGVVHGKEEVFDRLS